MRTSLSALPAIAFLFLGANFALGQTNRAGQNFPAQAFANIHRGANIPSALGWKLPAVAAWYGQTADGLRNVCRRDRGIAMDRQGRLHYVCSGQLAQTTSSGTVAATSTIPASDTFLLNSLPGATKVIYLDFTGHVTSGTPWNTSYASGANINTPPYDIDGATGSFSATELTNIQTIWRMVAEDFAPFNVNVTTQDPGIEALRKTTSSDANFGIRVCIGGSSSDWFAVGAGGVAYLDSFVWNSDTPAFVFPVQLGNGDPKFTAEATSHEIGHTFGLNHDGQGTTTEYYAGHADWAPIMGSGYYKNVVQWSKGEYTSANNLQDDTAVIASICPARADQHGGDILTATALSGTAPTASGLIETRLDADLFRFTSGAGTISFTANPATNSPNLDIILALYNGVGNLVTSSSGTGLSATLSTTVPQGTYYLSVDGAGTGTATTAYNDYGSLGQYTLSGLLPSTNNQPPVAVADNSKPLTGTAPLTVTFSSVGSSDPDGTISSYDWDFGNGSRSTSANPAFTYSVPGTYTASLVVVDNAGVSSVADTVTVVVQQSTQQVFVSGITMTLAQSSKGFQATANVTVRDQAGNLRSGATVAGRWSGIVSGSTSKATSRTGVATFASPTTKSRGTFTFTVTGITLSGFTYAPTRNVETADAIATP